MATRGAAVERLAKDDSSDAIAGCEHSQVGNTDLGERYCASCKWSSDRNRFGSGLILRKKVAHDPVAAITG